MSYRPSLLTRLDAGDRALFLRCVVDARSARGWRWLWTTLTHLGGAWCSILAAVLPLAAGGTLARAAEGALLVLLVSHLAVQLVKRTAGRPRPSRATARAALAAEPDRFSFPSGHAAAAMSVAFGYAIGVPTLAPVLLAGALLVGTSRVCLGVHYPGDVVVGQAIAIATGLVLLGP
ncbi:MAG TPA: phosphatase PAP2 family protein [Gemmatimonadaceae bacterium]|nr:phosphatase PAP2 family protein [Gemmatimonadaceae bacterium]